MTQTTYSDKPMLIEKENICNLKFPEKEVLKSNDDIMTRARNLERALKLGNLQHSKIKIVFEDTQGIKQVETTIWGVTDKRIILKHGILIPIHCIHEIKE